MSHNDFSHFKIPIPVELAKKLTAKSHCLSNSKFIDNVGHSFNSCSFNAVPKMPLCSWPPNVELGRPSEFMHLEKHKQNELLLHHHVTNSSMVHQFQNPAVISSTPLHRTTEIREHKSLLKPKHVTSNNIDWSTSSMSHHGSSYSRGSESVSSWMNGGQSIRSITTGNQNYCAVMIKACNLYLERSCISSDLKNTLLQAVNEMRSFVPEAVQDLKFSSSKSHFSRHASSIRSGFSKVSDRSKDTLSLLQINPNAVLEMSRSQAAVEKDISRSVQCSATRLSRADTISTTINIVEKSAPKSLKRNRDSDDSDEELVAPTTVKRKLGKSTSIKKCIAESSTSEELRRNVTLRKGQKVIKNKNNIETRKKKNRGLETTLTGTPVTSNVETVSSTTNRKLLIENNANVSANETLNPSLLPSGTTTTRSGRAVKKPIYYQVPSTTEKPPTIVHTRRGRAVKLKNTDNIESPKASSKKSKENLQPKRKRGNKQPKAIISEDFVDDNDALPNTFATGIFGGEDFFIPEVTQSTRRRVCKVRGLDKLAAQTPPLLHFTANLNPQLVTSLTPSQTPDWQISQRTQSEVKQLQKRKIAKKSKNVVKPVIKPIINKKKKLTKEETAVINLMRDVRPAVPIGMEVVARRACSDSEKSENSFSSR